MPLSNLFGKDLFFFYIHFFLRTRLTVSHQFVFDLGWRVGASGSGLLAMNVFVVQCMYF